jgi:hypothetical protein
MLPLHRIGELLRDSEAAYAGQAYCLAPARFAAPLTPVCWPPHFPQADQR